MKWLERVPLAYGSDIIGHDKGERWHTKTMHYKTLFETRDPGDVAVKSGEDGDETFKVKG